MSKAYLGMLGLVAMISMGAAPLFAAEEPPAKPEDLILRVGDTITWTPEPGSQHRLRFGGTVTINGAPLELTKFADVQRVLENFSPTPPAVDANGVVSWPAATRVTAKVKADSGTPAITGFFFTCGFNPHSPIMVTVAFKVQPAAADQPARNIQIISAHDDNPRRWVIQTTPGNDSGNRSLRRQ